ncbi:filamentous hemagglutinin N-terminal domain-containing protein [Chlorogloeopsis sp. ULAP02]|uniref:two-partner secretion domain-containing protein n=1 Tax=Chlorogloeopsis sp. ULAP02 TaxID=3107926 RepID=UPI0031370638
MLLNHAVLFRNYLDNNQKDINRRSPAYRQPISVKYRWQIGYAWRSLFFFTLPLAIISSLAPICSATAQIVEDNSLDATGRTSITRDIEIRGIVSDRIDGGTTRDSNLFHSFAEFNVGENRGVYFSNPAGIENILTRVTGGNPSNIQGRLGVIDINNNLGTANLFLINPNGIVFGPNARLDLGGSFFGSTANSVVFDNGFEFSAANPQAPLLNLNIPVGLRFRDNPGSITIGNSQGSIANPTPESPTLLEIQPQKTLALVGGGINLNGQRLRAPGGRIELGGLQTAGTVGINDDGSLSFPSGVERADISMNAAEVDVTSGGGGSIAINARNINILGGSDICAGIGADPACGGLTSDFGSVGSQAGDITLNALETITIADPFSDINNQVNSGAVGNGGNINLQARSLSINNGGRISANTFGQGNAGSVNISINETFSLDGGESGSFIFNNVLSDAVGNSGGINISTGSLFVTNGGQITSDVEGEGNSGKITIVARDTVSFDGRGEGGFPSGIFTNVGEEGQGNSGGIDITTGSLSITKRAQLASTTQGIGDPGDIIINAPNQVFLSNSIIISEVTEKTGVGNGGDIKITTGSLILKDASALLADSENIGNAGNIIIDARDSVIIEGQGPSAGDIDNIVPSQISTTVESIESTTTGEGGNISISTGLLSIKDDGFITSFTEGKGNAGDININALDIQLTDSDINSGVKAGGEGKGGDINIETRSLSLSNGSKIDSSIFRQTIDDQGNIIPAGRGEAGNIRITASDTITLAGVNADGFSSGLFTLTETGTSGSAGDIFVETGNLRITDGAIISATTSNSSDGGNIFINARNFEALNGGQVATATHSSGNAGAIAFKVTGDMTISGFNEGSASGILANTSPGSTGKGGSIFIDPKQVTIKDGGTITATSAGTGEAGNITLEADNLTLDRGAITAESGSATGGNINLDIKDLLLLRHNSLISATAGREQGGGDGGNVNIDTGFLVAFPKENSDITANAFTGSGGRVDIQAEAIFGIEPRDRLTPLSDITASSELGVGGTVSLNTPEVDPSKGLVELPENVVDPTEQIAQNPCQQGDGSKFIITGRGGLPPSPNESFSTDNVRVDWIEPAASSRGNSQSVKINQARTSATAKKIVPAQGWVFNKKGDVVLTAYNPTATNLPQRTSSQATVACPAPF